MACDGLLWLSEVEWGDGNTSKPPKLSVGTKLGYVVEDELSRLKARIAVGTLVGSGIR